MNKPIRLGLLPLFMMAFPLTGSAGSLHIGYDFGQMAANGFKHVAGEISYSFENEHALRIAVFNVALSERHLSSNEASAVDGNNVEGIWRGLDLYYDYPVTKNIFVSPSLGYHDHKFTHTVLGTSVDQSRGTAAVALSYLDDGILGFENLYWRFSIAAKYDLTEQDEQILGDAIVSGDSLGIALALSIGYEFEL